MRTATVCLAVVIALVTVAPVLAAEGKAGFSFTLLGLGTDLTGVHYDEGWMLIVGKGGLIAEARREGVWNYRLHSMGGGDLESVVWSPASGAGIAVGAGRVVQIESIRGEMTVRDLPFLRGRFVRATWSLDGSFALLMTDDGRVFTYRLGEPSAYEVRLPGPARVIVSFHERGGSPMGVVVSEVKSGNLNLRVPVAVFADRAVLLNETNVPEREVLQRLVARLTLRYPTYTGLITLSIRSGVLVSFNDNVVEIDDGERISRLTVAFKVLGAYAKGSSVAVVGTGGGIAIVDVASLSVRYVSIPSAERIYFIDPRTAVITSASGLFVYSLADGSVEHIPMSSPPTAFLPEEMLVADKGGRIYRLIRPEPWKGGLSLVALVEDGYASDMARAKDGVLLVVRKSGSAPEETRLMVLNSNGLRVLNGSQRLSSERLSYVSSSGEEVLVTGSSVYALRGIPIKLSAPEASYGRASWHPKGCVALIPGTGHTIAAYYPGSDAMARVPLTGSRDVLAASWSPDGRYALVGGNGFLYVLDGSRATEVELPYVVTFRDIASSPDSFLASTSLGLMLITGRYIPSSSLEADLSTAPIGPDAFRVTAVVVPHSPIRVRGLYVEGTGVQLLKSDYPLEMAPSCAYRVAIDLRLVGDRKGEASLVRAVLETDSGPVELGYVNLRGLVEGGSGPQPSSELPSLLLVVAVVAAAGFAAFRVVRHVRSRRRSESPQEEQRRQEPVPQEPKSSGAHDEPQDEYWKGGIWGGEGG
ncbi:MAG: hypothetical protein QXP81_08580 [Nitrososphaerota archaeon]